MHILNKKLIHESDQKEELLEELESLRNKSEIQKSNKVNTKKEISSLTKLHKAEMVKLQEEIKLLKNSWIDPEQAQKMDKREKELEIQIKSLKEDISRKKEMISSLKQTQEKAEKEVTEIATKIDSRKEDIDKISKLSKEVSRKDGIIKELKLQIEELKSNNLKTAEEASSLQSKYKSIKSELNRKEIIAKEAKDKLEEELKKLKEVEDKTAEVVKLKETIKKYKQDCDRKEMKISALESKLETNASEIDKLKSESMKESVNAKNEFIKENKKHEGATKKLKLLENITETAMIVIRRMIKEMIITTEKLRSEMIISRNENKSFKRIDQNKTNELTTMQTPAKSVEFKSNEEKKNNQNDFEFYKESMDILGVSLNELEEFVHPTQSPIFDYNKEPSWISESKNTLGPGLNAEDLEIPTKDNRDLDVFSKILDAIISDPEKLLTEWEDIIQIFKKLLKEISVLEQSLKCSNSKN